MSDKKKIKLYGTAWCPKSANLRNYLQSEWIEFEDLNVETQSEAEAEVRAFYDGELKFPTLSIDGQHIKNPSISDLNRFLKEHGVEGE